MSISINRHLYDIKILSLNVENERADAGRNGRTCHARPKPQARTETGETSFSLSS